MSDYVADIITEMESIIVATVSAEWNKLPFVHDLAKNSKRTTRFAYGVRPLAANTAEGGIVRAYTLDHFFEVILTDTITNRGSDDPITTSLGILYDVADDIFKELVNSKVNLPLVVLSVSEPSMQQPEIIESAKIVALRLQLKVKYRGNL